MTVWIYFLLIIGSVSLGQPTPINNERQPSVANANVNQITSTILSDPAMQLKSTKMQWIKTLKNLTENGGSAVLLECQVQSSYPVTFNWYRYNNPLEKHRFITEPNAFYSSIRLRNLKDSEAGFYTCEVSNGFETISSTGFVRVKNAVNLDHIDMNDDSLPSIEFQPEIITNHEVHGSRIKCELYSGSLCRSFLGSQMIFISQQSQNEMERALAENLQTLTNNRFLSSECHRWLLPMICSLTYPLCDQDRASPRSVCRRTCHHFQKKICPNLFINDRIDSTLVQSMSSCDDLPTTSDDPSCVYFNEMEKNQPNVSSSNTKLIDHHPSAPQTSLLIVLLSILIPVVVICCILIFFCWCCHHRNHDSHLSSCSSSSTPIKKSSHLVNTVTSSPFRSSITTHHQKIAQRHLAPSSSSSVNTNLTNGYLRQTLLRSDVKRPLLPTPSVNTQLSEIPYSNIRFLQELGEGEYGRIYKGELIDSGHKCIIKTLQSDYASSNVREEYGREIEIFRNIRHSNISCLIGICLQVPDCLSLMIYERLNDGDLHEFLLQRSTTVSLYQQRDLTDFLYIAIQIVSGMIYLAEKNFVHNDLSAKNILISEHMDIKITNVARYRPKYDHDYYKIANRSLPVRWMAVESLLSGICTEMSDVWSFGVLLWEMFSYGTQPYHGRTNPEVIEMIRDRKLLACPNYCPKRVYTLMCSCWEELSEQRPTFTELMGNLRQLEDKTTTLSSTTSSSLAEVPPATHSNDTPKGKYRTFIAPPTVPTGVSTFIRNDVLTSSGRTAPQSISLERDSIQFDV